MEDKEKKEYEISFLVREEGKAEEVKKALLRHAAEVSHEGAATKIRLAYPIKKEINAYFGYFWFFADASAIAEIDHDLRLNKDVLRFLVVTSPVKKDNTPRREMRETPKEAPQAPAPQVKERELTNEDLEKKLEEILH